MRLRILSAGSLVLWLTGCSLLFTDHEGSECESDFDCFESEVCSETFVCVPTYTDSMGGTSDGRVATFDSVPQVRLSDMAVDMSDMAVAMAMDVADVDVEVMVPPMDDGVGPAVVYPGAECFADAQNPGAGAVLDYPSREASTHVPYAFCTPYGLIWTEGRDGEGTITISTPSGAQQRFSYSLGTVPVVSGTKLMFLRPRTGPDGEADNIYGVDLAAGTGEWLYGSPRPAQSRPVRGDGFSAFVQALPAGRSQVVILTDRGEETECKRPRFLQWGVAAAGDTLAWFERPVGARQDRLVTLRGVLQQGCDGRFRELFLPGSVDSRTGVQLSAESVVWIEQSQTTGVNEIYRWPYLDSPPVGPERVHDTMRSGTPIRAILFEDLLAEIRYQPTNPRYLLKLVSIHDGFDTRLISPGVDVRHPSFSPPYLMWSQRTPDVGWKVHYARLF